MTQSMRLVLAAVALAIAMGNAVPSRAADMVLKAPPEPVWAEPWTGFFIGGNVGGGFGNKKLYDIFPTPDFALDADTNMAGWVGGLQFGYNYQYKWLVVGVESDFDWSGVHSNFGCFTFGNQQCTMNSEWFGTIVGKIGGVFGSALLYVDGGAAWTRDTMTDVATVTATRGGVQSLPGDLFLGSQIRAGWTVGVGVEYLLSHNWSVRAEYSYMNFGEQPLTVADGLGNAFPEEVKQTIQLVKVGFDYRFNGSGLPGTSPVMSYAPAPILTKAEAESPDATIRAFSVLDVAKFTVDGLVGGLFALRGDVDTSGPRLWVEGGAGAYQFYIPRALQKGVYTSGAVLGGYGFEGNNYSINLLAGLSAENDMLSTFDQADRVQGTQGGVKVRADAWINPTPTTLIYGEGEYTTAFQTYWTAGKLGWDVTNGKQIFVGPEVVEFGNERFNQWRVGAHITQIKIGKLEVALSSGYARDSVVGSSAYTHVEANIDF